MNDLNGGCFLRIYDGLLSPHYPNVERLYQVHLGKKLMNSTINEVTKMSEFFPDLVIVRRFGFLVVCSQHFPPSHQVCFLIGCEKIVSAMDPFLDPKHFHEHTCFGCRSQKNPKGSWRIFENWFSRPKILC